MLKINLVQPVASMKEFLAITGIEELDSQEISVEKVLDILAKDMMYMKNKAEEIRKAADSDDIYDVVAMLEDHLINYNKNIWFINSMAK